MSCGTTLQKGTIAVGCEGNGERGQCFLACRDCTEKACGPDAMLRLAIGADLAEREAITLPVKNLGLSASTAASAACLWRC